MSTRVWLAGFLLLLCASSARADVTKGLAEPRALQPVRVDPQLGRQVPLELVFTTSEGAPVQLLDLVRGDVPVLLVFAYTRCKSLCSVVLKSETELLRKLTSLVPGRDFLPVLVGLDPRQTSDEGRRHQATLLARIGWAGQTERFPYLLGKQSQIERLAGAVGFRYAWDERTEQYAHPAVLIVLDRAGRVFQYLHAVGSVPEELETSLRAAARADAATAEHGSLAGDLLRCFRFDPALSRHRERIVLYFRIGAGVIFGLLLGLLVALWRAQRRARP